MLRFIFLWAGALAVSVSACRAGNWPAWRGPAGDGVSDEKNPPTAWSAAENVNWKTPLPGGGDSTPIVWDDRVFITCATDHGRLRGIICFDRGSGKILWKGETPFAGAEPTHDDNPYCASSPITDGKSVFAWLGSAGMVAYDFSGKQLWHTDLGAFNHIWGNASTPVLYNDTLILNCGPGTRCFMVALDKKTGKQVWKRETPQAVGKVDQFKGSWSSPVLFDIDGKTQVIIGLPGYVGGFDPADGAELWRCRGLSDLVYANPLVGKDTIVAMSGYGGPAIGLRTPRLGEHGDLTASHRLWTTEKNQQRIGSGIMVGGKVYILNEPGIAQCIQAATGKVLWKGRAAGSTWSSTMLADGKLYTCDQSGVTVIWSPGDKLEILHQNALSEKVRGSLAFSDGQIFIRTYENLYCIGARRAK